MNFKKLKIDPRQPLKIVTIFVIFFLTISFFVTYLVHASSISKVLSTVNTTQELNSAKIYTEVIKSQLTNKVQTEKNIQFINQSDESLEDIFIVNKFGGIIFPISQAFEIIQDPEFDSILSLGSEATIIHDRKNNKIFSPLFSENNSIEAVVVLEFSANADRGVSSKFGLYLFIYLVFLVIVIIFSRKIIELLEAPWFELADKVEQSLSGEKFAAPEHTDDSLVGKHQFLYFRILSKLDFSPNNGKGKDS